MIIEATLGVVAVDIETSPDEFWLGSLAALLPPSLQRLGKNLGQKRRCPVGSGFGRGPLLPRRGGIGLLACGEQRAIRGQILGGRKPGIDSLDLGIRYRQHAPVAASHGNGQTRFPDRRIEHGLPIDIGCRVEECLCVAVPELNALLDGFEV